jgi:hypothetical protein
MALVRTDVSEEPTASFVRVTRIGELGTTLAATSNRRTLRRNTSVFTRTTRRNIAEDTILHSHRRENLKSYRHWIVYHNSSVECSDVDTEVRNVDERMHSYTTSQEILIFSSDGSIIFGNLKQPMLNFRVIEG